MNVLYFVSGIAFFTLTVSDIIITTFTSNGGGPVTNILSEKVWRLFMLISGRKGSSTILEYAGPAILVLILLVWILGLWLGMFLMLLADTGSIVDSSTLAGTGALEKLYYAGFTLSTLGVGDYKATSNGWRLLTSAAAFSGLTFITASITYFVPVLSAVGLQSRLSFYISSMGRTPQQVLANSWNGKDFSSFFDTVSDLCQMLMQHTINHHTYPVIHYFHNSDVKLTITPAIVQLDETHKLLQHAVAPETELDQLRMSMLETTLSNFLEMVKTEFLNNAQPQAQAPVPDLELLREKGIPLKESQAIKQIFEQDLQERRSTLTALLEADGWAWQQVYYA